MQGAIATAPRRKVFATATDLTFASSLRWVEEGSNKWQKSTWWSLSTGLVRTV